MGELSHQNMGAKCQISPCWKARTVNKTIGAPMNHTKAPIAYSLYARCAVSSCPPRDSGHIDFCSTYPPDKDLASPTF